MARNKVKTGDILLTRTGANRGQCAYFDRSEKAIASSHTFIIRPRSIDPKILTLFLNTKYGTAQIDRGVYGAAQPEIAPYYLGNIWIPGVSEHLAEALKDCLSRSNSEEALAEQTIKQAEQSLLDALGLSDWTPPDPLTYTAKASKVFSEKRIDSQFFRPKFSELKTLLERNFKLIALKRMVLKGRTVPYSESGIVPIIRSGDLSDISDEANLLKADDSELIFYLKHGDILISSIGFGSIGKVQVFDKKGAYGTVSEVTVVRQNELNPYYLATFLRSIFGQLQIEHYITGATGQLHLNPSNVERFFIPVLGKEKQSLFQDIHLKASYAKIRSKQLLDVAKCAVEIAIEEGEAAALAFLEKAQAQSSIPPS